MWGTTVGFIISAAFIWAYATFMAAWYSFNLSEPDAWLVSTWWRSFYSVYLLGFCGWLLFMCVIGMAYKTMLRNPWFLGLWSGLATGGILGVQINTIGVWQIGYDRNLPPYYTLACSIAGGAILLALIFITWSAASPTAGGVQHFCIVWVGSYMLIKSIGVLVGSYPNEFDMSPPETWETYVYVSCMWLLALLIFIFQAFLYGILSPKPAEDPTIPTKPRGASESSARSSRSSATFGEQEKIPLLAPVGSAADSRNLSRQQEVVEFGGVRALRPDSENRRLFV
jgi:hypothetical protein